MALDPGVAPAAAAATASAPAAHEPERLSALVSIPAATDSAQTPVAAAPAVEAPAVETPTSAPVLEIETTGTMPFSPALEPPHFDDVMRIVDPEAGYTTSADSTAFILGHSRTPWRGHSPGNDWHDLQVDDIVTVDGVKMRVAQRFEVAKTAIADVPGLWKHVAGRVVLITCVPKVSGAVATENLVAVLEPAPE